MPLERNNFHSDNSWVSPAVTSGSLSAASAETALETPGASGGAPRPGTVGAGSVEGFGTGAGAGCADSRSRSDWIRGDAGAGAGCGRGAGAGAGAGFGGGGATFGAAGATGFGCGMWFTAATGFFSIGFDTTGFGAGSGFLTGAGAVASVRNTSSTVVYAFSSRAIAGSTPPIGDDVRLIASRSAAMYSCPTSLFFSMRLTGFPTRSLMACLISAIRSLGLPPV